MDIQTVDDELAQAGFVKQDNQFPGLGQNFLKTLDLKWSYYVYASVENGTYHRVDVGVVLVTDRAMSTKGMRYRLLSEASLNLRLSGIINDLKNQAYDDDRMKCPKCKIRYVHLKEPRSGQNWSAFLSCDGFAMIDRKTKMPDCDGTLKSVQGLMVYR